MSLTLTQLAADNFQRANVSPLAAPWALDEAGDSGLQIVSDVCESQDADLNWHPQIYNYTGGTPNDQFASMTLGNVDPTFNAGIAVRYTDNGISWTHTVAGYVLQVGDTSGDEWSLYSQNGTLASGASTHTAGDVWTLAAVGDTIFVFKNGVQLASVIDTANAAGKTALAIYPLSVPSVQITDFAMGSASINAGDPPSDPPSVVGLDGIQVKVIANGSQYGPIGSVVTLSTQVANQKIEAGEVEAFGTARGDAPLASTFEATQATVLAAAGIMGADNTGVAPLPVPILMVKTGKTISVDWQIALQRILNGDATLV